MHIPPYHLDRLTADEFVRACKAMQKLRDEIDAAKKK